MKILLVAFLAAMVLAVPAVSAADFSDYPGLFFVDGKFAGQIIVGKTAPAVDVIAASEIAVALQQLSSSRITAYTDSEFANVNAILIGLPCDNAVTASILGTGACTLGLNEEEGWLKLLEKGGKAYLVVSGASPADTRKAARFLALGEAMPGSELRIIGTLDSPEASAAEPLEIRQPIPEPEPEVPAAPPVPQNNGSGDEKSAPDAPEESPQQIAIAGQPADSEIPANLPAPQPPKQNILAKIIAFFAGIFS